MPQREINIVKPGEFDCPPVLTMNLSLETSQFPCPLVFKGEGGTVFNASRNDGIYFHHLPLLIALPMGQPSGGASPPEFAAYFPPTLLGTRLVPAAE
jgi:hypothetical protein